MGDPWVLWMTLVLIAASSSCLAFRTSTGKAGATKLHLMTKAGESEALPRRGSASRENEIAAIFRGVAYGVPTQGPPNETATTPVTPETLVVTSSSSSSATLPSASAGNHERVEKPFTDKEAVPKDRNHTLLNNGSRQSNHNPLIAKDTYEIYRLDKYSENNGGKDRHKNGDLVSVSTYLPLATSHTAYDISSSSNGKSKKGGVDDSNDRGVLVHGIPNSPQVRWSLGIAWWVHVYVSVGLFTLLALVALCLITRLAITTHLLPRPHYFALNVLIFFASFLRSIHILHDAHGMKHLLPVTLMMAIEEFEWPCLTAALAVVLVAVLKVWHYPRHPHLALALAMTNVLYLITLPSAHLAVIWLKQENFIIRVSIQVVTVAWGGVVGVCGMWAVWRESRDYASHLSDVRIGNNQDTDPSLAHPARLVLTASLTQLLLAGLHLCTFLVQISPEGHVWVWWSCITVSRGLELIVGSTLVTAAALTWARPVPCCALSACCQKRTAEVIHPTEIKMIHPMGVYTLQPTRPKNEHAQTIAALSLGNSHKEKRDHSSLDYVTADFQLVWNHSRQRPLHASQSAKGHVADNSVLHLCPKKEYSDMPNAHILPIKPQNVNESFVRTNAFSFTLPRNRMYVPPQSLLQFQEEEMKSSQGAGVNFTSKSSTLLSGSSGSSKLYSSPQIPLRMSRSWDELSTGHIYEDIIKTKSDSIEEAVSDLSEVNSDNMTDFFFSEAESPSPQVRLNRRSQQQTETPCYVNANFPRQQAVSHPSTTTTSPQHRE